MTTITGAERAERTRLPDGRPDTRNFDIRSARALRSARISWAGWIRHDVVLPALTRLIAAELATRIEFRAGSCTVAPTGEIARTLGVSRAAVAAAVSRLEQRGWLMRELDAPDDRPLFRMSASLPALREIDPEGKSWQDTRGAAS